MQAHEESRGPLEEGRQGWQLEDQQGLFLLAEHHPSADGNAGAGLRTAQKAADEDAPVRRLLALSQREQLLHQVLEPRVGPDEVGQPSGHSPVCQIPEEGVAPDTESKPGLTWLAYLEDLLGVVVELLRPVLEREGLRAIGPEQDTLGGQAGGGDRHT